MTQFTADEYKQAELIIMRRDSARRWKTHRNWFLAALLVLVPAALIAHRPGWLAVVAGAWLFALTLHYLHAIRWFDRAKGEFQGRVDYVAQQLHRAG